MQNENLDDSNDSNEIDMNKTSPPELMGDNKEANILESNNLHYLSLTET